MKLSIITILPFLAVGTTRTHAQLATLSADLSYVWSITDFQGHRLDLSDGLSAPFTPIQSFAKANTSNQEWTIFYSQNSADVYEIQNTASGAIMTHTTALLDTPGPAIHAQIVGGSNLTWWKLDYSKGDKERRARIIEPTTGLALTAWHAGKNGQFPSSPLTLEWRDDGDERQLFTLTCLRGWSFPDGGC